jgi:predicted Zn-ribbon and HTH transcriptional regulator
MTKKTRPPRCVDCGQVDHLKDGVCPSCHTERMLDMAEHYAGGK